MKPHLLECVEMQNYKVEVKNHSEAMEAQDLFLEIGFKKSTLLEDGYPKYVVAEKSFFNGEYESCGTGLKFSGFNCQQITLPELRAMVSVQKYEELAKKYDGVKTKQLPNGIQFKKSKTSVTIYPSTGTIVSDVCGKINVLNKAGIGKLDHEMNKHFSVITPKQKEYLVKTDTGYTLQVLSDVVDGHDGIIEVPDGSNIAWKDNSNGFVFFTKIEIGYRDATVIWQRESLNDQVASAEEYRKSFSGVPKATLDAMNNIQNAFDKAQCAINAQNAMAKLFTYPQYLSSVVHGKEFIVKPNQKKDESKLFDTSKFILEYFTQPEELPFVSDNAWSKQIGGDHYKKLAIQPMEYALQNKLDYAQANVVKYVTRHADKNGKQDLLKAIHNIELMIAHYYSGQE